VLAIIDEQDKSVDEKRHGNELGEILAVLDEYRGDLAGCVVESTYNWYWLVDGLIEAGYAVSRARTSAVPQYAGLKYSNDQSDARHLAHLLRRRRLVVRQRTLQHLSLHSLIARYSRERLSAN